MQIYLHIQNINKIDKNILNRKLCMARCGIQLAVKNNLLNITEHIYRFRLINIIITRSASPFQTLSYKSYGSTEL